MTLHPLLGAALGAGGPPPLSLEMHVNEPWTISWVW